MEKLRIVFMGTPEFAVGILDAIIKTGYDVVGVITVADKPAGRGQKIKYSAVKEYALKNKLPLLQPPNLKEKQFLEDLAQWNANVQVVVAFRMLPEAVWKMPRLGTFNLHASLLPHYRGAAPINWAIMNGETKTGVTSFFIDNKIDTGAIILSHEVFIGIEDTVQTVHDRLMHVGGEVVIKTLELLVTNTVVTSLQEDGTDLKTAYKLNKENCKIDWSRGIQEIYNHIRGLSPYPAAWTFIYDRDQVWHVKIYQATLLLASHHHAIGLIVSTKKELKIAVKEGYIVILTLQFPGKKKMRIQELLNGMDFSEKATVTFNTIV